MPERAEGASAAPKLPHAKSQRSLRLAFGRALQRAQGPGEPAGSASSQEMLLQQFPSPPTPPPPPTGPLPPLPASAIARRVQTPFAYPQPDNPPPGEPGSYFALRPAPRPQPRLAPAPVRGTTHLTLRMEQSMVQLDVAMQYVLINEGADFCWVDGDAGGPTRYGCTQATLSRYIGRPATVDEVKNLTVPVVTEIYRRYYWLPNACDKMPTQPLATALLDVSVLTGDVQGAKLLQAALRIKADGHIGPQTLAACTARPDGYIIGELSRQACLFFAGIASRDSSQAKFLADWTFRSHKLLTLAKNL